MGCPEILQSKQKTDRDHEIFMILIIISYNIHHLSGTNHADYDYADTWPEYS